jgi:dTMP kinase
VPPSKKRSGRGLFVTFEGIEGSGKTTQIRRVEAWLLERDTKVLATRQPGGTHLGTLLRKVLLGSTSDIDPATELLLMFADRRQHLTEQIEPALAAGVLVLCDRYTDASRAYQGAGRGLGEDAVDELHRRFCRRDPDRTYLFDLPVEIALERLAARDGGARDRIEREGLGFHRRVRAAYRRRAAKEPKRILVVEATRSEDRIFEDVRADLEQLLERYERTRPR